MLPDNSGSEMTPELLITSALGRNKSPESGPERILVDPLVNSGLNSWSVYPGQTGAPMNPGTIRDPSIPSVSATDAAIDLFIELFELKEKNNWLRRQATVILLQQLFGGTVERKVTENLAYFCPWLSIWTDSEFRVNSPRICVSGHVKLGNDSDSSITRMTNNPLD
jgi:hypothetical protein